MRCATSRSSPTIAARSWSAPTSPSMPAAARASRRRAPARSRCSSSGEPKLLTVHLEHIGSASSYRAVDFRKPVLRNILRGKLNCHFQDLPVFNGKYSTTCYLDETQHALNDMMRRMDREPADVLSRARGRVHASPLSPDAGDLARDELSVRARARRHTRPRRARRALRAREAWPSATWSRKCARARHLEVRQRRQHRRRCLSAQHPVAQGVSQQQPVRRASRLEDVARLRGDEGHRQRLLRGAAGVDGGRPRGRPCSAAWTSPAASCSPSATAAATRPRRFR